MIEFIIDGDPIPQPRPQVTRTGRVYVKDNGIHSYRHAIQKWLVESKVKTITGPVEIKLAFGFVRPPSHYTKAGNVQKSAPPIPTGCDIDNLLKGVFDSLNGLAITDDRWVGRVTMEKIFSSAAYTEVQICSMTPRADGLVPRKSKLSKGFGLKGHHARKLLAK